MKWTNVTVTEKLNDRQSKQFMLTIHFTVEA